MFNLANFKLLMRYWVFAFVVVFAVAAVGSCSLFKANALKTYNSHIGKAPFDAIIVPGLPLDTVDSKSSILLRARMRWAAHLYRQGIARNIIFSGSAVHTPYVEAVGMKLIAEQMGIPPQHAYIEDRALHSTENVDYGIQLANQLGFKNIAVASDPFQCYFLQKHIAKATYPVAVLPLSLDSMKPYNTPLPKVDLKGAYVQGFVPLDERSESKKPDNQGM